MDMTACTSGSVDSSSSSSPPPYTAWARSLEHVLDDRDILDVFRRWMQRQHSLFPIELYYAIRCYKNTMQEMHCEDKADRDKALMKMKFLSCEIYKKFMKRDGDKYCQCISDGVISSVRAVVRRGGGGVEAEYSSSLFDACLHEVIHELRGLHAQFTQSPDFVNAVNRYNAGETLLSPDTSQMPTRSPSVASSLPEDSPDPSFSLASTIVVANETPPPLPPRPNRPQKKLQQQSVPLTAKTLRCTQIVRENALGTSKLENILWPSATLRPYVGAANTSKNDSAVSSAFSSEVSSNQPYQAGVPSAKQMTKRMKEDQKRQNPPMRNAIPRNEFLSRRDTTTDQHATEEQRQAFFNKVTERLNAVETKRKVMAFAVESMHDIGTKKRDARAAVAELYEFEQKHKNVDDEDEDVEVYLHRMNDSNKPSPGSQRSPGGGYVPNAASAAYSVFGRRRSPKSTSPERRFAAENVHPMMTSSFPAPYSLQGFAPPPSVKRQPQVSTPATKSLSTTSGHRRTDARPGMAASDTSGIGSGVSSACMSQQPPPAAFFEKMKMMQGHGHASTGSWSSSQKRQKQSAGFSSLPRQSTTTRTLATHNQIRQASTSVDAEMTIGYVTSADRQVPYVKKVARVPQMTLKEFKNHFGIGKHKSDGMQFFFKSHSDDASIPYELLLVADEQALLPTFEGKIMAELKSAADSD